MTGIDSIKRELQRLLRNELDDCDCALYDRDIEKAQLELDSAIAKVKRVIALLNNLPRH